MMGVLCLIPAGCSESPAIQKYVVASENQKDLTSELLRREFPPIPFRWEVPEAWDVTSNDQFSVRAWKAGPPEKQARITLGQFPARTERFNSEMFMLSFASRALSALLMMPPRDAE